MTYRKGFFYKKKSMFLLIHLVILENLTNRYNKFNFIKIKNVIKSLPVSAVPKGFCLFRTP